MHHAHTRACKRSGEREQKILGGAVSGVLNSLERNWSGTAQLRSSAAHIMCRSEQVRVTLWFFFFSKLQLDLKHWLLSSLKCVNSEKYVEACTAE